MRLQFSDLQTPSQRRDIVRGLPKRLPSLRDHRIKRLRLCATQ